MDIDIQSLVFDFQTMITIVTIVVAGVSSLFYFRSAFKSNDTKIGMVETLHHAATGEMRTAMKTVNAHMLKTNDKLEKIQEGQATQHTEIVRIGGHHSLLAARITSLEERLNREHRLPAAGAGGR